MRTRTRHTRLEKTRKRFNITFIKLYTLRCSMYADVSKIPHIFLPQNFFSQKTL